MTDVTSGPGESKPAATPGADAEEMGLAALAHAKPAARRVAVESASAGRGTAGRAPAEPPRKVDQEPPRDRARPPADRKPTRADKKAAKAKARSAPAGGAAAAGSQAGRRPRRRVAKRQPESAFWKFVFPVLLLLLIIAIPVLMLTGWNLLLQSKEGKFEVANRDENAPDYKAITPPTPTMLLVQVDDAGKLAGLTVLSQTSDSVGGVVMIPTTTVPPSGKAPFEKIFADSGQAALVTAVQDLLGVGLGEVQVIDANQWNSLLTNVGSLSFQNPEAVDVPVIGLFPKGQIVLEPSAVGGFLGTPSPTGDDLNRLRRNEAFWNAILAKLDGGAVNLPGDPEKGLTHFLPLLAKAQVAVEALSVKPVPTADRKGTLYIADDAPTQIAKVIPFPIEATPGGRVSTRVLDGTGKLKHGVSALPALVKGGAQINGIGNASNFEYKTTQVIFYDDAHKEQADKLRQALGVGELAKSGDQAHDVDVTVILGADFAAQPAPSSDTVITKPPEVLGTVTVTVKGGKGG